MLDTMTIQREFKPSFPLILEDDQFIVSHNGRLVITSDLLYLTENPDAFMVSQHRYWGSMADLIAAKNMMAVSKQILTVIDQCQSEAQKTSAIIDSILGENYTPSSQDSYYDLVGWDF
jgi:hypothetical protein